MARTRTVHVLLAALAVALLALQLFAQGAPDLAAQATEPPAAVGQASLGDGPIEPEDLYGHHGNRARRQQEEDLLAVTSTRTMASAIAVPGAVDADVSLAAPPNEQRAPGNRSPAALQVFRC
ncbi:MULTISPECIES: hypothetical protein [unclassified Streptomyces]|uniref:hypothetical protein n=1 Tax=unclassified Streptomyces TaxID=2593676 RepID=UPI0033C69EFF